MPESPNSSTWYVIDISAQAIVNTIVTDSDPTTEQIAALGYANNGRYTVTKTPPNALLKTFLYYEARA